MFLKNKIKNTYYESIAYPGNTEEIKDICRIISKQPDIECQNDISFKELDWGTSKKEITKKLGKPLETIHHRYENNFHQILFYKSQRNNIKSSIQFHILDKRLFYISRNYRYLNKENSFQLILEHAKEFGFYQEVQHLKNLLIKDSKDNILRINTDFGLKIEFISGICRAFLF